MNEQAELSWDGKKATLPLVTGSLGERAIAPTPQVAAAANHDGGLA